MLRFVVTALGLRRPWVMRMRWVDLLFAHWPIDPAALRPLIPPDLELDLFDGRAYLGIVPFGMEDVAPRGLPTPPVLGAFPELNVRTYVRHGGLDGVWFLGLDAASRMAVEGARTFFHLPYLRAVMSLERDDGAVSYRSVRADPRGPAASFVGRYEPSGPVELAEPCSLEAFLTERRRLFAVDGKGRVLRTEIRHAPWPLQPATAQIDAEGMAAAYGLRLPADPPHLRFSRRLDVVAWWPRPA